MYRQARYSDQDWNGIKSKLSDRDCDDEGDRKKPTDQNSMGFITKVHQCIE